MSCVYKNFVGFSLWILLVQHLDLTLAIDEHYTQYVPICAPASLVGAPGKLICCDKQVGLSDTSDAASQTTLIENQNFAQLNQFFF